jgi:hypothetical protein
MTDDKLKTAFEDLSKRFAAKCDELHAERARREILEVSRSKREHEMQLVINSLQKRLNDCDCQKHK